AESDLMLLAQYLEQFKAEYGDYPRVDMSDSDSPQNGGRRPGEEGNYRLYSALNGMRPVRGEKTPNVSLADGKYNNPQDRQKSFIDRSKFQFEYSPSLNPPSTVPNPETDNLALLDPWGNVYRYFYDPEASNWENKTYVLYSIGPDGLHEKPNNRGYPDYDHPDNLDNIYANRK